MVKLGLEARTRMQQLLREKRERMLVVLTAEYKGGTMTPEKAMGIVAELSTLQGLLSGLDNEANEERRSV